MVSTHLSPGHFANGVCDAGARSNGGGAGCIPDRCNSTLSRGAGRAGSRLLTLSAHFHKTIPQTLHGRCHITLSPWTLILDTWAGSSGAARSATAPANYRWVMSAFQLCECYVYARTMSSITRNSDGRSGRRVDRYSIRRSVRRLRGLQRALRARST